MIKYMFILSHFSSCFDENSTKKDADVFRVLLARETLLKSLSDLIGVP